MAKELKGIDDALAAGATVDVAADSELEVAETEAKAASWPEPLPLPSLLPPVPPMTEDMLPEALRPFVVDTAERMQVPLEFVAVPYALFLHLPSSA